MEKRYFAAIQVDSKNCPDLLTALGRLKRIAKEKSINVSWVPVENWHVTTWFFGDLDPDTLATTETKLEEVAHHTTPLEIKIQNLGAFPEVQDARVIWAGVRNTNAIKNLRQTIDQQFSRTPTTEADSEFVPHLTLGRLRSSASVRKVLEPMGRKTFGQFTAKELVLFESQLQNYVPIYTPIQRFQFQS